MTDTRPHAWRQSWIGLALQRRVFIGFAQPIVGLAHALRDELRRLADGDAAATTADQRGCNLEQRGCVRFRVLPQLSYSLRPGDGRLAHCAYQIGGAQLSLLTEPGDDHRFGTWCLPWILGIGAGVNEHLVRARRFRVQPDLQRFVHRAAQQPVHHELGAGQAQRPVVTEQQRLANETQVAVDDGDRQRGATRSTNDRLPACEREHVARALRRRTRDLVARRPAAYARG